MKKGTKALWVVFGLVAVGAVALVALYAAAQRSTFGRGFVAGARSIFTLEHWVLRTKGCMSSGIIAPDPDQAETLRKQGNARAAEQCEAWGLCGSETIMCSASFKKETTTCAEVEAVHRKYASPERPFQVLVMRGLTVVCHEYRSEDGLLLFDLHAARGHAAPRD